MEYKKLSQSNKQRTRGGPLCIVICLFLAIVQVLGCAAHTPVSTEKAYSSEVPGKTILADEMAPLEEKWGVRIVGVRLTANSYMIDFRYKVIDIEKASPLMDRNAKPYLLDEANSAKVSATDSSVGALRSKGSVANRNYFIIFTNPGGAIKRGSKVTIISGDFKVEHLIVE
jgi:hypothetical protein